MDVRTLGATWDEVAAGFRWQIPARFNIAADTVDRQRSDAIALIHEDEAGAIYVRLCEADVPDTVKDHPAVAAFYQELCAAYPEIDDWPEDDLDKCPWSVAHDRSDGYVLMCMQWGSVADDAAQLVVELADKHRLLCYDPQGPSVYLPDRLK